MSGAAETPLDPHVLDQCVYEVSFRYDWFTLEGMYLIKPREMDVVIYTMVFEYCLEADFSFSPPPEAFYSEAILAMNRVLARYIMPIGLECCLSPEAWRAATEAVLAFWLDVRHEFPPPAAEKFPLQRGSDPWGLSGIKARRQRDLPPAFSKLVSSAQFLRPIDMNDHSLPMPSWSALTEADRCAVDAAVKIVRVAPEFLMAREAAHLSEHDWVRLLHILVRRFSQRLPCTFDLQYPRILWSLVQASRSAAIHLHRLGTTDLSALTREEWRVFAIAAITGWMGLDVWEAADAEVAP